MRATILILSALALGACGGGEAETNEVAAAPEVNAEEIAANDLTAIDAVAAEDANIAADVNFVENEGDNASGNGAGNAAQGNRN
jgi:hypothetical protein